MRAGDTLRAAEGGREALSTLFSYLAKVGAEGDGFVDRVAAYESCSAGEDVMDLIEQHGKDKRAEGLRAALTKLLELGPPSAAHAARIAGATAEDLAD